MKMYAKEQNEKWCKLNSKDTHKLFRHAMTTNAFKLHKGKPVKRFYFISV